MQDNFIEKAGELINQGRLLEAKALLERAVSKRPTFWSPVLETDDEEIVYSWDRSEFLAYVEHRKHSAVAKPIVWFLGSFSQAWFLLAWIKVEIGQVIPALYAIEHGIALEPDHPWLLCEKGHILQTMHRPGEALTYYQRAETARSWAPVMQGAAALRGQGIVFIDLGKLADARQALLQSLALEPENRNARHELQYISDNLAELEVRASVPARDDEVEPCRQYAICTCSTDGTFVEPDRLMRFHTPRAASERIAQMRPQELTVAIRVDKLGQLLGRRLAETPLFERRTLAEFEKWLKA